ncbi:MAG: DEAD/DEAH box helicase family protein [Gammaproteobacteria bacterium]|nr:DEAD/DEAH box helicase family protein [Gammaproteobacteria bacterium]
MTTIHTILDDLARAATDARDKGDKFERLMAAYLRTEPLYQDQFSDVWLWSDWPGREGRPDTGIDLVAQERTGGVCAIQCKFYDPSHTMRRDDIDSFLAASSRQPFTSRMLVTTTDKWNKNAEEVLDSQQPPVIRLRVRDLDDSTIDWGQFALDRPDTLARKARKIIRPHQAEAIERVARGFDSHDRGKIIMACGTGKTYTALKVAERMAPPGGLVLFLVPSISLLSQSLKEWTAEAAQPLRAFAVCSDTTVGKKTANEDMRVHDLAYPATTDATKLVRAFRAGDTRAALTVIFSTYQSIAVLSEAQRQGLPELDLIICDEAHRTTGATLVGEEESHFIRVHDQGFLKARKRLYMTATPRIYTDGTKTKAREDNAILCSMDDPALYGPEFYRLGFGEAVGKGLLCDYKVMVLAIDEKTVGKTFQDQIADRGDELRLDDAVKIIGCWNGLAKRMPATHEGGGAPQNPVPMRRAVAFARSIKDSQQIAKLFEGIVHEYLEAHPVGEEQPLRCEVQHVDGTFNVLRRNERLDWLKADTQGEGNVCRILTNARCLSEGVDVPALDAAIFLNPRDSEVDVVQSVGRVMRRAPGKDYGYIILPIGIPADKTPEEALKDNQKYKIVWQVLQALRAHDDRFNATVNKIDLNKARTDQIQVIGVGGELSSENDPRRQIQMPISFPEIGEWRDAIYAKIVQKCGDRRYWESWAGDVAKIADRHRARIQALIDGAHSEHRAAFDAFLAGLRRNLNPSISETDAIEMLSQHLVTKPVFDALFANYSFAAYNPVSQSMQAMVALLEDQALEKETESLTRFYDSVRQRAEGIDNAEARQRVIVELYEKFFKAAFPRMAERLGIVYTPVEVVDFILQSAEVALQKHFGAHLADQGVQILDPFTGTGTFMVRLLQSGLIKPQDLARKYHHELHANEIVLLAYYIAAINIEAAYYDQVGDAYESFPGIVLTDTFQMAEKHKQEDYVTQFAQENSERVDRQKRQDIRVIIGNPPYSAVQSSANQNNQNLQYETLDSEIRRTYAARSRNRNPRNLYDSYIRALRWASDRLKDDGVIGFVTNGSFLDANNMDGLRKCLTEEFSHLYVFNLRGNARTQGEQRRKEAGGIFGEGSRTPVAITILIKDKAHSGPCELRYYDIGDYHSRANKLAIIQNLHDIEQIAWEMLAPNPEGDWVSLRDPVFDRFLDIEGIVAIRSQGVTTSRDAWSYNFSRTELTENVSRMMTCYNDQVVRYSNAINAQTSSGSNDFERYMDMDSRRISWSRGLKARAKRREFLKFDRSCVVPSLYRPFAKQWLYFSRLFNEYVNQMPQVFPTLEHPNIVIAATGIGAGKPFSALVTDCVPNFHMHDTGQCFPLYWYEKVDAADKPDSGNDIFAERPTPDAHGYIRHEAITDTALAAFQTHYRDTTIGKEDLFWYVYGVLHAPDYRERFASDLKKMLPRIPYAANFWVFSRAGRALGDWHLQYETVEPYPLTEDAPQPITDTNEYRVTRMVFAKRDGKPDKTTIIYNAHLTLRGIPLEAYDYVVNGKSAIEWVMERYAVTIDKDSQIRNDANDWSEDPRYIVDLVKRVVRVSVETVRIVGKLPSVMASENDSNAEAV